MVVNKTQIKEKRVLFTTIDEIDNDIDDCKENIEPSLQNNVSDKNEHRNDVTTTAATDGHRENDSSCVATASYNSVSMTHSKLVEPRVQHSANSIQGCKLGSNNGQDSAATKSLGARRIPITGNRHDSDKQNCVSVTPFEKNRTVYKSIETPLHHVGISSLPKQGGTDNVNLQNWHSTANLKGVQVSVELDNDCRDSLKSQDQGKVVPHEKIKKTEMAMHTDEKEEKEDSDGVSSASKTVKTRSTPDNESVDKFVGRIKKSQKRQSIVELNESIVESQAHMHKLQVETEKLQDVAEVQEAEGSQTNMNILRQLELIAKQQEQLQVLQKQLQEQLSSLQTKATQVSGSNNNVEQQGEGHVTVHQQTEGHLSGIKDVVNVNTCSENILNNNMSETLTVDNQNISKTVSLFVSSSSAISQTLSHSRTWSPSKDLALTPSKRQPHVAIESTLNITPYATRKLPQNVDTSSKFCFEQIRNPTPVKREGGSCVTSLFPAVPPLWTPMAFKEVSQDQQNLAMTFDLCDNDIKTCTSQVAAIDLSVKRPKAHDDSDFQDDTVLPESPSYQQTFTPISAFTRLGSPDRNVGQLSLRANTASTPVDLSAKKKRLSLRRTVISSTNERYQEALLDEECALYSCRLQTPGHSGRGYVNPIARMLLDGDDMHFIPIRENSSY